MNPIDLVLANYKIPFELRQYQKDVVNETSNFQRCAHFLDIGTGKTCTSTMLALYKGLKNEIDQIIVIAPPILSRQWQDWLMVFNLSVTIYEGTPVQRKKLNLDADASILTYEILRNDFTILKEKFQSRKVFIIIDECAAIRNPSSKRFKVVRDLTFLPGAHCCMLSGTPINKPWHSYGVIKIKTPEVYRNWRQFAALHITSVNQFDEPQAYSNMDIIAKNLMLNAVRVRSEDVLELPEITYQPIIYDLSAAHLNLYNKIVEEKLLELDDGRVIDGATQQRLYHTLQRVILTPVLYGGVKIRPAGFDLVEMTAQEAGIFSGESTKLTFFVNYRETNENTNTHVQSIKGLYAVQAYGKLGVSNNLKNIDKFLKDPNINTLIAHPGSIGVGINLQSVCATALFLELPLTSDVFQQALGRFYRQGQKRRCLIKIAIAANTIQVELAKRIVNKEQELQKILPTKQTLKRALMGQA